MRRFIIGQNTGKALTDDTGLSGGKLALVIASTILGRRNVKNLGGDNWGDRIGMSPQNILPFHFFFIHYIGWRSNYFSDFVISKCGKIGDKPQSKLPPAKTLWESLSSDAPVVQNTCRSSQLSRLLASLNRFKEWNESSSQLVRSHAELLPSGYVGIWWRQFVFEYDDTFFLICFA